MARQCAREGCWDGGASTEGAPASVPQMPLAPRKASRLRRGAGAGGRPSKANGDTGTLWQERTPPCDSSFSASAGEIPMLKSLKDGDMLRPEVVAEKPRLKGEPGSVSSEARGVLPCDSRLRNLDVIVHGAPNLRELFASAYHGPYPGGPREPASKRACAPDEESWWWARRGPAEACLKV